MESFCLSCSISLIVEGFGFGTGLGLDPGADGGAALGDLGLGDFGLEILSDLALEDVCEDDPKMFFGAAFFLLLLCTV